MARFEWLIIGFLVLGLAVFELVRTRRGLRRIREQERAREAAEKAHHSVPISDNNNRV